MLTPASSLYVLYKVGSGFPEDSIAHKAAEKTREFDENPPDERLEGDYVDHSLTFMGARTLFEMKVVAYPNIRWAVADQDGNIIMDSGAYSGISLSKTKESKYAYMGYLLGGHPVSIYSATPLIENQYVSIEGNAYCVCVDVTFCTDLKGGKEALENAGYVVRQERGAFFRVTHKVSGEKGVIMRQSERLWHFFPDSCMGISSGRTPDAIDHSWGDVIEKGEIPIYMAMIQLAPPSWYTQCKGLRYISAITINPFRGFDYPPNRDFKRIFKRGG